MTQESYVSFETAKLLKEKGFIGTPENFHYLYGKDGSFGHRNSLWSEEMYPAPSLGIAMRWLREVHKVHIIAEPCIGLNDESENIDFNRWFWTILKEEGEYKPIRRIDEYPSYEQALESAIKYCLENLIQDE